MIALTLTNQAVLPDMTFTLVQKLDRVENLWIIAVVIIVVPLVCQHSPYPWAR
jgi:hypothetical protein